MKHSNFAVRGRFRLMVRWEQGDPCISFADKSWHASPHAFMKALEPENVDVPFCGSFYVAHAHGDVINAVELHKSLDRMYRIYGIAQTIELERVVLNALARATLRREWCLFAGFRRPIGSGKRYSVELDCVVVNLLECGPVVRRPCNRAPVGMVGLEREDRNRLKRCLRLPRSTNFASAGERRLHATRTRAAKNTINCATIQHEFDLIKSA
jgi:hypothetical protein